MHRTMTRTRPHFARPAIAAACLSPGAPRLHRGQAHPDLPGKPGLIAYDNSFPSGGGSTESDCAGEGDAIFTVHSDGSHRTKLQKGVDPSYSPQRKADRLQCLRRNPERPDADEQRRVERPAADRHAESERGRSRLQRRRQPVFFTGDTGGKGYSQISRWRSMAAGSALTKKRRETSDNRAAVAANGRFVVFDREGQMMTMRPNGTHPKELAPGSTRRSPRAAVASPTPTAVRSTWSARPAAAPGSSPS